MWEKILERDLDCRGGSARLKVPGGWIVRSYLWLSGGMAVAQTFVSDPNHEWKLNEEPE